MFCKWCGETLNKNAKSCPRCGHEVSQLSDCGGFYDIMPNGAPKQVDNFNHMQGANESGEIKKKSSMLFNLIVVLMLALIVVFSAVTMVSVLKVSSIYESANAMRTVRFIGFNGKEIKTVTVKAGEDVTVPTAPPADGQEFVNWVDENGKEVGKTIKVNDDMMIKAIYNKIEENPILKNTNIPEATEQTSDPTADPTAEPTQEKAPETTSEEQSGEKNDTNGETEDPNTTPTQMPKPDKGKKGN